MTKVTVKIEITPEYRLKISTINKHEEKVIVETIPSITFNTNTIDICKENDNAIHFIKQWLENPDNYSTYSI